MDLVGAAELPPETQAVRSEAQQQQQPQQLVFLEESADRFLHISPVGQDLLESSEEAQLPTGAPNCAQEGLPAILAELRRALRLTTALWLRPATTCAAPGSVEEFEMRLNGLPRMLRGMWDGRVWAHSLSKICHVRFWFLGAVVP